MQWFCRSCWRHGELAVEIPNDEAIRTGTRAHRWQVDTDVRAQKVPAGMEDYRNAPMMEKYPSVDCNGDIRIGDPMRKKQKFDKKALPELCFGE